MSKRLQVVFDDDELRAMRDLADRSGMTVSAWVRQAIRHACTKQAGGDPADKLEAIRSASRYAFPTADIEGMLAEIEDGCMTTGTARAAILR